MDTMVVAFFHARCGVPAIILNLAEKFSVDHHPGTTWFMMVQRYKSAVPELGFKVR
jgi:hypothetical protein